MTPAQLRRIADLLRYGPSHFDANERWELIAALLAQANQQENRP